MKSSFRITFSLGLIVAMLAMFCLPQQTDAQRLSHPNYGGGGRPPAAAYHPPSAVSRPAPEPVNRPSQPAPNRPRQESRPTINGGSYNVGNHNYNQNAVAARPTMNNHVVEQPRENVTVQRNVAVHQNVTVHQNVNVYHNHYQPAHAYAYHPYHPYYWGHNWHPLGYLAASLARDAFLISIANQQYYYDEGVYYQPASGGYTVVPAPVGAMVSVLPPGFETTMVGDQTYFYYGGAFYIDTGNGYQVVQAPYGAVVTQVPDGAVQQEINGEYYLVYNNTYYQPVSQDGQDAYEVVQVN